MTGRRNSRCKGPDVGGCLICLKKSESGEASTVERQETGSVR